MASLKRLAIFTFYIFEVNQIEIIDTIQPNHLDVNHQH